MWLSLGEVVGVDVTFLGAPFHHVGVVVGSNRWGETVIVSKSRERGAVVEQTFRQFAAGKTVTRHPNIRGRLAAAVVARRALARRGEPWSLGANCEHFVREVHGLVSESPQLQGWLAMSAAGATAVVAGAAFLPQLTAVASLGALGAGVARGRRSARR